MKVISSKLVSVLLLSCIIGIVIFLSVKVQGEYRETIALWHFDEIQTPNVMDEESIGILGGTPPPLIVDGKFDKALSFDGDNFVYVTFSPSLYSPREITIEAWVYVKAFKNTTYNNLLVICYRTGLEWETVTRICGIALTPDPTGTRGFLRGYVYTDKEHFNEIITDEPAVPINQWVHVAFTRSLASGMHLYINGEEIETWVSWGVKNPQGNILMGTEIYFGHDAEVIIDEPRICDAALEPPEFLTSTTIQLATTRVEIDVGFNLMLAIIVSAVAFAAAWLLRRIIQTWSITSKSRN